MHSIQNHTKITIMDKTTGEDTVVLDTATRVVGECVAGMPYVDVIDDSLDSFTFVLKDYSRRKPFKPFSFVTYEVNDGESVDTTTLFVLFDNVQSYSRIGKTYQHTVTCVESAKILEKTKIFNLNLTNLKDTLLRQFEKACINAEPTHSAGEIGVSSRYSVSDNLNTFLTDKPSHDFYFSNTDFRSVLDAMLAPYNARATVENVEYAGGNMTKLAIGYIPMDIVKDVAPEWTEDQHGEILAEELENDGQNYAGKIVARGYNSVSREPMTFTDTFKSANATISDATAAIFFPFPISDKGISSLKFLLPYSDYSVYVNIANRIITQEEYDLLPENSLDDLSAPTRANRLAFSVGSNQMDCGTTYKGFLGIFDSSVMKNVLEQAVADSQDSHPGLSVPDEWWNLTFVCSYYPIIDTVADIVKPGVYDKDDILMGIMDSQTEQTLDIERHGKKLHGLIKRTGNTEYVVDVKAKYFSRLLPIMSRIDLPDAEDDEEKGYVLYKREYAVYDNFINCRYHFSKNCNAIQTNAGVNRERHIYDIPLEADEAPLVVKKYLLFSLKNPSTNTDGAGMSSFAYSALNTLIGRNCASNEKNWKGKLKYLLFQSKGKTKSYPEDEGQRFVLPICSYALGKCMNFAAKTLDNYSVGYSRENYTFSLWGDGGYKMAYNVYVDGSNNVDADTIGECTQFHLTYAYDFESGTDVTLFPKGTKGDYNVANNTEEIQYNYHKDRTQSILFLLAVDCLPVRQDNGSLIVGSNFAKNNNLVKDNGTGLTGLVLHIYTDKYSFAGDEDVLPLLNATNEKYSATEYFEVWEHEYGAELKYKGNFANNETLVKAWAITDENGNIYLACNGKLQSVYASISDFPI